jgi:hypothetical protein
MKNARPQNSETSAADTANYTSKMNRAAIVISRIMAVLHPDCVLLAALLCLLLWGAI